MNAITIKAVIIGHAIADSLGVPVEFRSRAEIAENPVTVMRDYGIYSCLAKAAIMVVGVFEDFFVYPIDKPAYLWYNHAIETHDEEKYLDTPAPREPPMLERR